MTTQDKCCTIVPYFKVQSDQLVETPCGMLNAIGLENVGTLLQEALKIAELTRLEIHGPEEELAKLREPLADLKPQFFTLEYGFRR